MTADSVKVSVIIPAYNASRHIKRCISSVSNQSLSDIEILIIDDGSTDDTLSICNSLASSDKRIRVISRPNGGVASARNCGIENARGQYISFLDSDDFFDSDMLMSLYSAACEYNADIVFDGLRYVDDSLCEYARESIPVEDGIYKDSDIIRYFLAPIIGSSSYSPFLPPVTGSTCICLYRSGCIGNLRFDTSLPIAEDMLFQLYVLSKAKNVCKISGYRYNYYVPLNCHSRSHGADEDELSKRRQALLEYVIRFVDYVSGSPYAYLAKDALMARILHDAMCKINSSFIRKDTSVIKTVFHDEYVVKASDHLFKKKQCPYHRFLVICFKYKLSFVMKTFLKFKSILKGVGQNQQS